MLLILRTYNKIKFNRYQRVIQLLYVRYAYNRVYNRLIQQLTVERNY